MSKTAFTLQAAQFSDSDNETPIDGLIDTYNREYSIIYQEIKSFLKQCKENINKYIQLNQFGARFNMYALYAQMTNVETSTLTGLSDVSKQQLEHQKSIKITYEKEFENIVDRMQHVIKDFLKFQIDFKRQYFGINIKQQPESTSSNKIGLSNVKNPIVGKLNRQKSIHSGSSARRRVSRLIFQQDEEEKKETEQKETELQEKLRQILKRKLAPQKQNIIKFCDKESDPYKNMLKLEQKIDMMQSEMILSKTREEKIIGIFNKRRIQNIQPKGHSLVHSQLIQTDSGNGIDANKAISKSQSFQFENVQTHGDNNMKSMKKPNQFSKPCLNIEVAIDKICEGNLKSPNGKQTPRQLISPKGIKSPSRNSNGLNFLCSPKNTIPKKIDNKNTVFGFRKKRQSQIVEQATRQKMLMGESIQSKMQKDRREKQGQMKGGQMIVQKQYKKQVKEVGLDGGQINKNREKFLMRRKSNNQSFNVGVEIISD